MGLIPFIGSSVFTPKSLSGLVLWLDAQAITGLSDNSTIVTWNDTSGNGHNASAVTNNPIYHTGSGGISINGHACVQTYNSGDAPMKSTFSSLTQPYTVAFVGQVPLGSDRTGNPWQDTSSPNVQFSYNFLGSGSGLCLYAGTQYGRFTSSNDANPHCAIVVVNGASSTCDLDGTTTTIGANPGAGSLPSLFVGNSMQIGEMGEYVVYSRALTTTEQTSLYQYEKAKWGTP